MNWADLAPHWPLGFDRWEIVALLAMTGLLKLDRGRILYRNSEYIDRLGWSIIAWDFVLGFYAATAVLWAFYPGTHHLWWQRLLLGSVIAIAAWQWYEVRKADHHRVTRVMGHSPEPINTSVYKGPDRRVGPVDRRSAAEVYGRTPGDMP